MPLTEFGLIDRYFRNAGATRGDVELGIGDDAALLQCPPGTQLVATIDTLVEGTHFPKGSPPASIGHRALAVNLSDLAAMGARPAWALLALTMPSIDESWLEAFTAGFATLAREHEVALVGGNTTSGPLSISVQILGHVASSTALLRSGGKPGDRVFVTGTPGDSAAGLAIELSKSPVSSDPDGYLRKRFLYPSPRVALGDCLRGYATACIDVSDGLLGDAGKLAHASGCSVEIAFRDLPVSGQLVSALGEQRARELALTGGEDYELCFTVSPSDVDRLRHNLPPARWGYCCIGSLREGSGAVVTDNGNVIDLSHSGYDHFHR